MRVALISDLHANAVALEAVLAEIREYGVDQIVCLGDVATLGPRPSEVLARLRDLACPCITGNHDAFMLDPILIERYAPAPIIVEAVNWCRARLSDADRDFIASFLPLLEIPLDDTHRLLLFHGTPRSHMEDMHSATPSDVLDEMLAGNSASVMGGGHTHVPMLRQHRGVVLINPGSVGLAFEQYVRGTTPTILPYAQWASVDFSHRGLAVGLHRVELDRKVLRQAASASDSPFGPALVAQYS